MIGKSDITDAQIEKYDPMIRKMINENVLYYWAGGNTVATMDPRESIGRLGKSVEDLIQDGRIMVLKQLRWFKQNGRIGAGTATESTLMFKYLKRKFITLSRGYGKARRGGNIVAAHMNFDDIVGEVYENLTPEAYAIAQEELRQQEYTLEPVAKVKTRGPRKPNHKLKFRIFEIAAEKGMPTSHGALAKVLGRSPSAMSNILHSHSRGTPEFRQKLLETFGVPLEELRQPPQNNP
jgi:transcriptional regulator with XRE-family HTH domain